MTIVLRAHDRSDDYSVIWKEPDRECYVGRIFHDPNGVSGNDGKREWFWTVDFSQRKGRTEPHQGRADSVEEAKAAWRRCWDSAAVPINWPP